MSEKGEKEKSVMNKSKEYLKSLIDKTTENDCVEVKQVIEDALINPTGTTIITIYWGGRPDYVEDDEDDDQ